MSSNPQLRVREMGLHTALSRLHSLSCHQTTLSPRKVEGQDPDRKNRSLARTVTGPGRPPEGPAAHARTGAQGLGAE